MNHLQNTLFRQHGLTGVHQYLKTQFLLVLILVHNWQSKQFFVNSTISNKPFSPFSQPFTLKPLMSTRKTLLQNLQVWNSRVLFPVNCLSPLSIFIFLDWPPGQKIYFGWLIRVLTTTFNTHNINSSHKHSNPTNHQNSTITTHSKNQLHSLSN